MNIESFQHSNIDEAEMGQLHALHLNDNAIAAVRRNMRSGVSLTECSECGDSIPEARRIAVSGCITCVFCQTKIERNR